MEVTGAGDLEALQRLRSAPFWLELDGAPRTAVQMAAVKSLTSELIARLARAAVSATRAEYGDGPLSRYSASLVVPDEVRAECAVLKTITIRWVMGRTGAHALQIRQRELLSELTEAVAAGAPATLEPLLADAWDTAAGDAQRQRDGRRPGGPAHRSVGGALACPAGAQWFARAAIDPVS